MSEPIEWAVVSFGFRGAVTVYKEGLGSFEEAEAWREALKLTHVRVAADALDTRDEIIVRKKLKVVWRNHPVWHEGDPDDHYGPVWSIQICDCGFPLGGVRAAIQLKTCPDCGRPTIPVEDRTKRITITEDDRAT